MVANDLLLECSKLGFSGSDGGPLLWFWVSDGGAYTSSLTNSGKKLLSVWLVSTARGNPVWFSGNTFDGTTWLL